MARPNWAGLKLCIPPLVFGTDMSRVVKVIPRHWPGKLTRRESGVVNQEHDRKELWAHFDYIPLIN